MYLAKETFVEPWLNGGTIPIFQAARYLSDSRDGTSTPDEVDQYETPGGMTQAEMLKMGVYIQKGASARGLYFGAGLTINGHPFTGIANSFKQNSSILCFSTVFDASVQLRLNKEACLQITDIDKLREALDLQIGVKPLYGTVRYTDRDERGHFLKSSEDAWQHEYRLAWLVDTGAPINVRVPTDCCVRVS